MAHRILRCAACVRHTARLPTSARASLASLLITRAAIPLGRRYATTTSDAKSVAQRIVDAPKSLEWTPLTPEEENSRKKEKINAAVKRQLKYLNDDPWLVQDYVEKALRRDAFEEACAIVQKKSTKDVQLAVAWNHLIDHLLQNQRMRQAFKLFNDVGHRGQISSPQFLTCPR